MSKLINTKVIEAVDPQTIFMVGDVLYAADHDRIGSVSRVKVLRIEVRSDRTGYDYYVECLKYVEHNRNYYWTYRENELFRSLIEIKTAWIEIINKLPEPCLFA